MTLRLLPAPQSLRTGGEGAARDAALRVERDPALPAEGYELRVGPGGVRVRSADARGERHARQALIQIRAQCGERLPGLEIRDWPDFPQRGYMLDVSRDRVPTRATLEWIVELLDLLRLNQLQLYTEHTFRYRDHETVWRDASPLDAEDVRWLDALCAERGIELVANQNCFGHMERWLRHAAYRPLAEAPGGFELPALGRRPPSVLAPTDEGLAFALGLCRELSACFGSRWINVNCDETWELGQGRSRAECDARGRGTVWADFVRRLIEALRADGHCVQFWGDIGRLEPGCIDALPREDVAALVWGYEAPLDPASVPEATAALLERLGWSRESLAGFAELARPFAERDYPFWVCPGTSSWNSLIGRLPNANANLLDAAVEGARCGARGYLITDWGDNGHLQPPSVSLAPLIRGAALAWCARTNRDTETAPLLDALVFEDAAGELGAALEGLGSVYLEPGAPPPNASALHLGLLGSAGRAGPVEPAGLSRALERLEEAVARIGRARPACSGGDVIRRELACAARLARHGAWRLASAAGSAAPSRAELRRDLEEAIEEQAACWLARSRPGGLEDSLARLRRTLADYA